MKKSILNIFSATQQVYLCLQNRLQDGGIFEGDDIIYANVKVTPAPNNVVQFIENLKKNNR